MTEAWKAIDGYEGLYEVSNTGLVRSLSYNHTGRAKLLKPGNTGRGYLSVKLCKDGKVRQMLVHRLVAEAFVPNPQSLETVNHKNEDKHNNNVSNLEWMTSVDNSNYGTRNKRLAEGNVNHPKKSKQVQMLDKQTSELLATFPSIQEAERQTGISDGNICFCCSGRRKSAGGYLWRYT